MNKDAEYPSMALQAAYNQLMNENAKLMSISRELLEALRLSADNRPVWATVHGIYDVIAKAEAMLK